jgi:uncharacterized metal-binding protein YceD (DUF177 family)
MNTRPQEVLSYRDLARQQAQLSRQIGLDELSRLRELVARNDADGAIPADAYRAIRAKEGANENSAEPGGFRVSLQFSMDPSGYARVEGTVVGSVYLSCNGCAELLRHELSLSVSCLIAETEAIADGLVEGDGILPVDVLVANGTEVSVAQIVEDEILLSLPERLCLSEPCERAPGLDYPAADVETEGRAVDATAEEDNPFSVLRALKPDS